MGCVCSVASNYALSESSSIGYIELVTVYAKQNYPPCITISSPIVSRSLSDVILRKVVLIHYILMFDGLRYLTFPPYAVA